ncbi:hypothetical protein [Streptomyces sp. MP131-18]|nr:hypothetical protein [Streptomyces sp. MP131-18]
MSDRPVARQAQAPRQHRARAAHVVRKLPAYPRFGLGVPEERLPVSRY